MANTYTHFCFVISFTHQEHADAALKIYSEGYIDQNIPENLEYEFDARSEDPSQVNINDPHHHPRIIVSNDSGEGSRDEVIGWLRDCYNNKVPLWPQLKFEYAVTTVPARVGGFGGGKVLIDFEKNTVTIDDTSAEVSSTYALDSY